MLYKIECQIAGGSFGEVWKAKARDNNGYVAIKKLDLNKTYVDIYKRILREIIILKFIRCKYSISLLDLYKEENEYGVCKVCLVLPFMQHDLRSAMKNSKFSLDHIIKIIYQILLALKYLSHCGILHRDLKPSNIGLNNDMSIKLLDYGLAREKNDDMTNYVVSRWYRPVEVFCTLEYSAPVDMWSAGCILVELLINEPLFPGHAPTDQVVKILKIMGMPSDSMLDRMDCNTRLGLTLFAKQAAPQNNLEGHISRKLKSFLNQYCIEELNVYPELISIIYNMLDLDPLQRIVPDNALNADIFQRFNNSIVSYTADNIPPVFSSKIHEITDDDELQEMIYESIELFENSD